MLDPDGELSFLERNRDWLRRRTVLLITHRPSSLRVADRIIEIRDGKAYERTRAHISYASGSQRIERLERPWPQVP
jgi:ABC-type multidrug transport system fused ATPase/permease subunit